MAATLRDVMARLVSAHRQGSRLALLFDYDGTLTPIVERPALARLEPDTLRLLRRLAQQPGIKVGIISGRSLDDLLRMVGLSDLFYAGTSGLELNLQGECLTHPEAGAYQGLVKFIARRLAALATNYPGAWVEDKRLAFTLHYRNVERHHCETLLELAGQVVRVYESLLRVVVGPMAWEVTPALGWDKGSALRVILESIGRPAIPVYAGDGANDAEALATTAALGGVALGVGACAPSSARYRLRDPAALVSFLAGLAEALAAVSAATVA